jgi:hypothetical protein
MDTKYSSERAFPQRQLESQMIAWLHYDPFLKWFKAKGEI